MADNKKKLLLKAIKIATKAHKGQKRKWTNEDYITHPIAVSGALHRMLDKVVGVLHDTVEDTSITLEDLRRDFPEEVVMAVDCLTRREGESYKKFVVRAMDNEIAHRVKVADIKHNMATLKKGHGLIDRYQKALVVLEE